MQKGDIVLIPFPFTDLRGNKLRPAVVLIEGKLDVTVCFITSQLQLHEETDILIHSNNSNGIKKTSLIKVGKIATLEKTLALGKIGYLNSTEMDELNKKLKQLLKID